jgi:hypothetical protein
LGDAGSLSVSASRLLRAGGQSATFVGFSASNLAPWGTNAGRPAMFSGYVTHLFGVATPAIEIPMLITAGMGTDNTRSSDGSGIMSDGMFAGFGMGLTNTLSAGISTTATQQNVGATLSIPGTGISTTVGILDVTNNTQRRQVSISVAYGF